MWIFSCALCITETCVGFPQPPEFTLYVTGLVCPCLGSQGLPSSARGLCALISVPEARPLCRGAFVHLFHLTGLPALSQGQVFSFLLPRPTLCATWVVCTAQVCVPPLPGHPARPLGCKCCVRSRGLYAMPHSATRARPLCHMGCVH